jgi:hypothetical protein
MTEFPNPLASGSGIPRARDFAASAERDNPLYTYGSLPAKVLVELTKEKVKNLLDLMAIPHEAAFGKGFDIDSPEAIPKVMGLASLLGLGGAGPSGAAGAMGGNLFDQQALRAFQRGHGNKPGARTGVAYKPEHSATYWEEGGQGYRPGLEDFVEVNPRRNEHEFFDPQAIEQASALARAGRGREAMHPIYGGNANRPNYGTVPEDYVSPFQRMSEPGVRPGYEPLVQPHAPAVADYGGVEPGYAPGAAFASGALGLGAGLMGGGQRPAPQANALAAPQGAPGNGMMMPQAAEPPNQMYQGWPVQAPAYPTSFPSIDPRLASRLARPPAVRPSAPAYSQQEMPQGYEVPATQENLGTIIEHIMQNLFPQR